MQGRDVIHDAFRLAKIYAPGEEILPADEAQGFDVINRMLDSWSTESLSCFAHLLQSAALQIGVNSYTIGLPNAVFQMTRPIRILEGPGAAYIQDTSGNNYPIEVIPVERWQMIGNRDQVTSNIITHMWFDPQMPYGVINVFPVPNTAWTLHWTSYLQLVAFPDLVTPVYLPPGYERALADNLAIDLKPYYDRGEITASLLRRASISKGNVKRSNMRKVTAVFDAAILNRATPSYNIYRDSA